MTEAQTTVIYLFRHGATDANLQRPYVLQGCGIDLPLSATGREEAAAATALMRSIRVDACYASTRKRAVETAEMIAGPHGLGVESIKTLDEVDVGRWEGMNWDTIREQFPREYKAFQQDCGVTAYLGGESYGDVARRAVPVLEALAAKHAGQTIAVVAHNVVNRCCLATWMGLNLARAKDIHQSNGGVNLIRREGSTMRVITVNSIFHLGGRV